MREGCGRTIRESIEDGMELPEQGAEHGGVGFGTPTTSETRAMS